jgi:nicotinate-nucleotide adenylyltransferase
MNNKQITGLFFGSFNPIHIGHLVIANYIMEYSDMKQLWFVISPQSPFKKQSNLLENYHRLELVTLAIENDNRFRASDIEFKLPTPSYTIDTLTYLSEKYPKRDFVIIMGADNLFHFHKWKNFEQIRDNFKIMVYPRPGIKKEDCPDFENLHWVEAPIMEVSSSFIRKAIREKKDIRYFLHPEVWKYMDEMNFYRQ